MGGRARTEFAFNFRRVAEQSFDFRGPKVGRINLDKLASGLFIGANFVDSLPRPGDFNTNVLERQLDEAADGVLLTAGHHIVHRSRVLQHEPHADNVVPSMTPVTFRLQVA